MIFAAIENFVFLSAIFALCAYCTAMLIRLGLRLAWWDLTPFALTRSLSGLILFPPILAAWIVLAALLPESWLGTEVFQAEHVAPIHEWHLLTDLTASFEPFLAYATVLFLIFVSMFVVGKSISSYLRIGRIVRFLEMEASIPSPEKVTLVEQTAARHGIKVGLVMSEQPLTFVWGFWQSKLILSSGLLNLLNESELRGVIQHETAHHARRDNLLKLLLSAASYLSPVFPLTRRLLRWQNEQIELVCDEIAAVSTREPLDIAAALVKVRRNSPESNQALPAASSFMSGDSGSIEPRVTRLLNLADSLPSENTQNLSQRPFFEISALGFVFVVSILGLMTFAPLIVHQTAESLIRLIT